MNIGSMPFVVSNSKPVAPTKSTAKVNQQLQVTNTGKTGKFGDVFNKIMAAEQPAMAPVTEAGVNLKEVEQLLNANSLEEVLDLLGISHGDDLLTVTIGDEEKIVSTDELMNIDDLLSMLNMNLGQLNEMVQEIMGKEVKIEDVWDFLQIVNEEPEFMSQITSMIQGETKGSTKDAMQLLQLIKLVQVVGENSDLAFNQSEQIVAVKEALQTLANVIAKEEISSTGKVSIEGFEKVVKQVETKVELSNPETNPNAQQSTTTTTTKTMTITLPDTNKTAQSEALVKQIEAVIQRSQVSNHQGTLKILLKLYPENLGSIRIELTQKDGMISARLLASTAVGKELLDSQIHQLKQAFVQQNIQLDRIDIQQSLQETDLRDQNLFNNMFKGEQQQSEEEHQESDDQEEEEKRSFKDFLINEEV